MRCSLSFPALLFDDYALPITTSNEYEIFPLLQIIKKKTNTLRSRETIVIKHEDATMRKARPKEPNDVSARFIHIDINMSESDGLIWNLCSSILREDSLKNSDIR